MAFLSSFWEKLEATWGIKKEFRLKVFFLTAAFFMLTACQAIWRPLKTAVFINLLGAKNIPDAKLFTIVPIIILILIYSKLVDVLRRHQLFYWFAIFHAAVGIAMYVMLSHPVYGLANTAQLQSRWLGWIYYFFMESFGAFMSVSFWSFANSINKPNDAKNYYSLFVAGSKIGGILGAGSLFFITLVAGNGTGYDSAVMIPNFILVGSVLLLLAAGSIYLLMRYVPGYLMHGYEAAYVLEKKREKKKISFMESIKEMLEGLTIIIKNPYIFGIMTVILSYEVIIVIFDYLFALAAEHTHSTLTSLANSYSLYQLLMHSIGLLIALFGTAPIQRFLGIRLSLFACPLLAIITIALVLIFPTTGVIFFALVFMRALNYGLNHPTREALFIPTTKAVKFKAKAWTDAFGSRISKAGGSALNKYLLVGSTSLSSMLSMFIAAFWLFIAYFLGRTFQKTVDQNKVIGADETESQ